MVLFGQIILLLFVQIAFGAITYDPGCNFVQKINLNETYYVYNPGYPSYYAPNTKCRWVAESPPNTILQLYCEVVDIPTTMIHKCTDDVLIVSPTGTDDLTDRTFCGGGQISINSQSNKMIVAFFSTKNLPGGRFLCSMRAVESTPTCDCGWRNTRRIVGGVDTGVNEFPMMAALVNVDIDAVFCGGTIISQRYVLTAAHCLRNATLKDTRVLVGDWDLSTETETSKSKLYNCEKFLIHQDFSSDTYANDIALIKTTQPIVFSLEVGPVCLPFFYQSTNFVGTNVTVLGWGTIGFGYAPSDVLQKVDLLVISEEVCKQTTNVKNRQFCTYTEDKDACQGDSGGPDLWQKNNTTRLQLLGITCTGNMCASRGVPGLNTEVSAYLNWIRNNTEGESFCAKM